MYTSSEKRFQTCLFYLATPVVLLLQGELIVLETSQEHPFHGHMAWWESSVMLPIRHLISRTIAAIVLLAAGLELAGVEFVRKIRFQQAMLCCAGALVCGIVLVTCYALVFSPDHEALQHAAAIASSDVALMLCILALLASKKSLTQDFLVTAFALIGEIERALGNRREKSL